MILTEKGKELFKEVEQNVNNLLEIEAKFLGRRDINFGTYNTMISKLLSECINKYYENNKQNKINIINSKIEEMFNMLTNSELDIILSKKVNENLYDNKKIKYVKLGELEEVIITNSKSKLKDKVIDLEDLKEEIIYLPRNDSISIQKFIDMLNKHGVKDNIKRIDSATMIKMLESGTGIGVITKEYIKEDIQIGKILNLKTKFKLDTSEIGIYIRRGNKFKELNEFLEILKIRFKEYN